VEVALISGLVFGHEGSAVNRRWGLQAAMTATYVAVTAGAVLLTELVIFGAAALSPQGRLTPQQVQGLAQSTAATMAAKLGGSVAAGGALPSVHLGLPGAPVTAGRAQPDGSGGVLIPQAGGAACDLAAASLAVIVSKDGTVLATSYPACYPVGQAGADAQAGAPRKMLTFVRWPVASSGLAPVPGDAGPGGTVAWATAPVRFGPVKAAASAGAGASQAASPGAAAGPGDLFGMLYLQVPAAARTAGGVSVSPSLLAAGLVVLAAAGPVGVAFGLLSTRRLTRRLKRLAALTLEVADGDFQRRVRVSGRDEVSLLEENFNRMAGQLQASLDANRGFAEAGARNEERARIARELHDSISQELFSLSALAGGLRRALPAGSPVLPEVETMERTAGGALREMRSLLLALRPVALEEAGLAAAIAGVCHAYSERLGIPVRPELELPGPGAAALPAAVEHAVLRVTQEAVANAARHAGPGQVCVRLRAGGAGVELEVADDGGGFDVAARLAEGSGLGLRTMRDRVSELGGRLAIDSAPGAGTRVRASFPPREAGVTGTGVMEGAR
jgi:two-component system, NarL family, sensor histidine kinase LiaS